jgi:hypothetical protein
MEDERGDVLPKNKAEQRKVKLNLGQDSGLLCDEMARSDGVVSDRRATLKEDDGDGEGEEEEEEEREGIRRRIHCASVTWARASPQYSLCSFLLYGVYSRTFLVYIRRLLPWCPGALGHQGLKALRQ